MNAVDRVVAEHECARLIAHYANLNDAGDWPGVTNLFIEGGRLARPSAPDSWITGREAILAAFEARPARRGRHLCTNIVVNVLSEVEATATSAIGLFVEGRPPAVGSFDDRIVRVDGEWKFAERRGSMAY